MSLRNSILVISAVVLAFLLEAVWHFAYTPDDSFIYFQYARNLALHGEVAFNRGEPSYGFTGPAWMLLSSLVYTTTGDVIRGTKILDLIFALAALPVFYAAARKITRESGAALLALCAFAANSWLIRWAGSGMESSMVTFVACLVIWAALADHATLAFVLLGVLVLLRPESLVLSPVAAWFFLPKTDRGAVDWRAAVRGIAILAAIVLAWIVYAKLSTGSYLPNTSVKAGWSLSIQDVKETTVDTFRTYMVSDGMLMVSFLALFLLWQWKVKSPTAAGWGREFWLLVAWLAAVIGFYILSGTNVVSRYLLLVSPCLPLLCLMVYERFRGAFPQRDRLIMGTAALIVLLHIAVSQSVYWSKVEPGIMSFQRGMETNLVRLGKWLGENSPDRSRVLVADIGAVGFYSERPLDDAAGLISPPAIPFLRAGVRPYDMIATGKYRQWSEPDYIIHAADVPDALHADTNLVAKLSTEFSDMKLDRHAPAYYTLYQVKHH